MAGAGVWNPPGCTGGGHPMRVLGHPCLFCCRMGMMCPWFVTQSTRRGGNHRFPPPSRCNCSTLVIQGDAPSMPTAYVWVTVRLCSHPRPLGAPPFLRDVRRAYMEPSRWRLKVSPTWKGGGQPRWTFRQGVPPLRAGRMRTPPAYQPRSLPPIIAHQLRSSLISLGHMEPAVGFLL